MLHAWTFAWQSKKIYMGAQVPCKVRVEKEKTKESLQGAVIV